MDILKLLVTATFGRKDGSCVNAHLQSSSRQRIRSLIFKSHESRPVERGLRDAAKKLPMFALFANDSFRSALKLAGDLFYFYFTEVSDTFCSKQWPKMVRQVDGVPLSQTR